MLSGMMVEAEVKFPDGVREVSIIATDTVLRRYKFAIGEYELIALKRLIKVGAYGKAMNLLKKANERITGTSTQER